jgi:hypothetical protein
MLNATAPFDLRNVNLATKEPPSVWHRADARLIGIVPAWIGPDYLRDQAAMYRQLAEQTDDPVVKNELLELASVCEDVANNIEDHLTSG